MWIVEYTPDGLVKRQPIRHTFINESEANDHFNLVRDEGNKPEMWEEDDESRKPELWIVSWHTGDGNIKSGVFDLYEDARAQYENQKAIAFNEWVGIGRCDEDWTAENSDPYEHITYADVGLDDMGET